MDQDIKSGGMEESPATGIEELATLLGVSGDVVQSLMESEEYRSVLEKFTVHLSTKIQEVEEYESTLREFSDNLDGINVQLGMFNPCSQDVVCLVSCTH